MNQSKSYAIERDMIIFQISRNSKLRIMLVQVFVLNIICSYIKLLVMYKSIMLNVDIYYHHIINSSYNR